MKNSYLTQEEINLLQTSGLHRESPYLIENVSMTQLSIARHYGGCTAYGRSYIYNPVTDELIRDDVVRWIGKERKKAKRENLNKSAAKQMVLF